MSSTNIYIYVYQVARKKIEQLQCIAIYGGFTIIQTRGKLPFYSSPCTDDLGTPTARSMMEKWINQRNRVIQKQKHVWNCLKMVEKLPENGGLSIYIYILMNSKWPSGKPMGKWYSDPREFSSWSADVFFNTSVTVQEGEPSCKLPQGKPT